MIVTAKIEKVEDGKLVLKPDMDISRFVDQKRPRRVEVRLDDGRAISADQRRKIFAIIRDISLWSGQEPEELRLYLEWDFCSRCALVPILRQISSDSFGTTLGAPMNPMNSPFSSS